MLSYQHIFHAGNHADLLKHTVLIQVLKSLNKKEKPYTFFDTHSGSGLYDLTDKRSLKTGEAEKGISFFAAKKDNFPQGFSDYLDFTDRYLKDFRYPGSPEIERSFMRARDTLILSELHPQEIENLRKNMKEPLFLNENGDGKSVVIQVHKRSGWEMLRALTPPSTKRGAVLIDPSYEEKSDYIEAADTIAEVQKKWSNGIIMLWYPLLAHREDEIKRMLERLVGGARAVNPNMEINDFRLEVNRKDAHKELSLEDYLKTSDDNEPRLYGSGMLVLNAPWMLKETVEPVIDYIKNAFGFQLQGEEQ